MITRFRHLLAVAVLAAAAIPAAAVPFTPVPPNGVEPVVQPLVAMDPGSVSYSTVVDRRHGYLYTSLVLAPGKVVKSRLATTTSPVTAGAALVLDMADGLPVDILLDEAGGFGLVLCDAGGTTRIVKFTLDGTDAPPTRINHVDLQPGESDFYLGGYDQANGFLYAVRLGSTPAAVAKVAVGSANDPMSRTAVVLFDPADTSAIAIAIDPGSGRGWVCCSNRIVQFLLGAGSAPPSRESHADALLPASFVAAFNPLTRQVIYGVIAGNHLVVADVSGPSPVIQGHLIDAIAIGRPAVDPVAGLMYIGMAAGQQGLRKYSISGIQTLPGILPAPAGPITDHLILSTAYDPVRGFVYGIGPSIGGAALGSFRQAPASGPDMNGYVNKLSAKSSSTKSNVKAQFYIFNTGTASASNFLVRTFLSNDERLSYDDVEIGKARRVKKLDAGKVRKLGSGSAVSGPVAGKFLIAVIDGEKSAGDGNYGDNVIISRRL